MSKSPADAMDTMAANLAAKTGKTLEQWRALAKQSGRAKHGKLVAHLKGEHGRGWLKRAYDAS